MPSNIKADKKRTAHVKAQEQTGVFEPAPRVTVSADAHVAPPRIGEVVSGITGASGGWVTDVAVEVINKGENLNLSFKQWAVVQALIEEGVRRGFERGQS